MAWIDKLFNRATKQSAVVGASERPILSEPISPEPLRILSSLGSGGMGAVDLVEDVVLGRVVARKQLLADANVVQRKLFLSEARRLASLAHGGIPTLYQYASDTAGRCYFLQRFVEGESLDALIAKHFKGDGADWSVYFNTVYRCTVRLTETLAYAHGKSVLHADIKPANVMLGAFGEIHLIDWGIPNADGRITELSTGTVAGTPAYMAPEQANGAIEEVDTRTDIFLLGATLYHALSGTTPYRGGSMDALMQQAVVGARAPLRPRYPTAPALRLAEIAEKCMSYLPEERYPSAPALLEDLHQLAFMAMDFPEKTVEAGAVIVRQGDAADSIFVIRAGRCNVLQVRDGEEFWLRQLDSGDTFGESALLGAGQRTASVVAASAVTLIEIELAPFRAHARVQSPWLLPLITSLVSRLAEHETGPARGEIRQPSAD